MHTVSLNDSATGLNYGLSPELWTRITHVNRKTGEATMDVKIDNFISTQVKLRRNENSRISDREWNRFVKVDGKPKLRSIQLYPVVTSHTKIDLAMSQVQMYFGLFVNISDQ